jgi:hypothetical protein
MDNVTQRLFVPTAEGKEMKSHLSYRAKRELLCQIAPRYREASSALKEVILDEVVAATGYARKYAIRLLNHPVDLKHTIERPRPPHYGPEVQQALHLAWTAANHICAKRLIPFLPMLVESLERHGHLHLSEECRSQLLSMSPATADRILRPYRKQEQRGLSINRAGTLLKKERRRRYQRSGRPHNWRTRKDPFEGEWEQISSWLLANPELTGVDIFHKLEQISPGRYRPTQVRTLQRGLRKLRGRLLVTFNDQWGEEVVNGHTPTPELRGEIVAGIC